jgi:hypothetical protein
VTFGSVTSSRYPPCPISASLISRNRVNAKFETDRFAASSSTNTPTTKPGSICSRGLILAEKAEVRRGALGGPFLNLVIELATRPDFTALAPISDKLKKQREYEELVTRFFAYSDGLEGYRDRPSEFLFKYTKKMNAAFDSDPQLSQSYRQRFDDMIAFVGIAFPNGFQRTAKGKATPHARFEAISLGSFLALQANPRIRQQVPDVTGWIDGTEFSDIAGSGGANAIGRLQRRMNFVRDRLLGA